MILFESFCSEIIGELVPQRGHMPHYELMMCRTERNWNLSKCFFNVIFIIDDSSCVKPTNLHWRETVL